MAKDNFLTRFTSIYTDKSINGYIRGFAWLATAGVIYFVGSKVYNALNPSQSQMDAKAEQDSVANDLATKTASGMQQSYSDSQYIDWANQAASSLSGVLSSTLAYSTIRDIFSQLQNDVDFLRLKQEFGIRTISRSFIVGGDLTNVTLSQAIRAEFDSWEIDGTWGGVALVGLNPTLAANGITYKI